MDRDNGARQHAGQARPGFLPASGQYAGHMHSTAHTEGRDTLWGAGKDRRVSLTGSIQFQSERKMREEKKKKTILS